ncbi:MAG: apolipoprotein N-acyltransferase [Rhodospirillales bacterium]|nr:apolipoprotein N-acyltransferase [Rhodospirillales bacterium]
MNKLVQPLLRLTGWPRRAALAGLGALAALALPPLYVLPALLPAFAGFLLVLNKTGCRKGAFAAGWWFGFGFFTLGLYWISNALLIDAARFIWFIPFSLFGLSALLGVFTGLAALLSWHVCRQGFGAALSLSACWSLHEWLRSFVMTGFPWNPIASVWTVSDELLQADAWLGPYGLGFLTVLGASGWILFWTEKAKFRLAAFLPLLLLALLGVAGMVRLQDAKDEMVDNVRLRLVQPNIEQSLKWKQELRFSHLVKLIEMSLSEAGLAPTHVIWAETAVPYLLDSDVQARLAVAKAAPENGLVITGAVRTSTEQDRPFQIWNSLQALDRNGAIRGVFDKFHLVPFGEYMPLKNILPLKKITEGSTDFSPGPGPLTIDLPGLPPVGPLICYEVIFPGAVADPARRPGWLLNLTNDSWYGYSTGPFQHFAQTRMRAVEEGLPLVRVANSGISGIIDAYGRVRAKLELNRVGILDSPLPKPLSEPPLYAALGDGPCIAALVILLIVLKFMLCHTRFSTVQQRGSG